LHAIKISLAIFHIPLTIMHFAFAFMLVTILQILSSFANPTPASADDGSSSAATQPSSLQLRIDHDACPTASFVRFCVGMIDTAYNGYLPHKLTVEDRMLDNSKVHHVVWFQTPPVFKDEG